MRNRYTECKDGGKVVKKIIRRVLLAILIAAGALLACAAFLWFRHPASHNPERIDKPTGYVQAVGTGIYDEKGRLLTLKGVDIGDWFVQEFFMNAATTGGFESGLYTQDRGQRAMEANPNLTDADIRRLYDLYMSTFIQEQDFANIADLGMNAVRINFTWRNLTDAEGNFRKDSWKYLDWALDMCERYHLYAIVDLHGAYGSQNQDQHSGTDTEYNLYGNEKNENLTKKLWKTIAQRYRNRTCIAGYDLLNECRKAPGKYGGKVNTDFYYELYQTVRSVDPNHMIFIEYFTFPIHGARLSHYDWTNICAEYHIYNQTKFSQLQCLGFYNMLNNFMGVKVPVYVGEWSCWNQEQDWYDSIDWFEKAGWSYTSWTYKANDWLYRNQKSAKEKVMVNWGVYETDQEPVDLATASYDQIAAVWGNCGTENARPTLVYDIYRKAFAR